MFTNNDHVIDHQGVHDFFGDHVTLPNAAKQKRRQNSPSRKGRCGAMVKLPVGYLLNLPADFSAFGNNALNSSQPSFSNKGYRCEYATMKTRR
jgi:hypothetical protein